MNNTSENSFEYFCKIVHPINDDVVRKIQDYDVWVCSENSFRRRVIEMIENLAITNLGIESAAEFLIDEIERL